MTPTPELKKIHLQAIDVPLLMVPHFLGVEPSELTLFASVDDRLEGVTNYFLFPKDSANGLSEDDRDLCAVMKIFRIMPYATESDFEITNTLIMAHAAPRFLAAGFSFSMLSHYDFDYLLIGEDHAEQARAILSDLFTVESLGDLW